MLEKLEQEVKEHVTQLFEQSDTSKLFYHNYEHTAEVVQRIEALAIDLNASDLILLRIAGWFHDVGYLYAYDNHEERSMRLAEDYLSNKTISASKIKLIKACIEATKLNLKPRNVLEKIIKDADIGYGVTERFLQTGTWLRKEWEAFSEVFYSDKDWEILQYNFLKTVRFYTDIAQNSYHPILQKNVAQQKKRLL